MCDVKDEAVTKIDKLTLAMHRLTSAMENFSAGNPGEGQVHFDAKNLRGASGSDNTTVGNLARDGEVA